MAYVKSEDCIKTTYQSDRLIIELRVVNSYWDYVSFYYSYAPFTEWVECSIMEATRKVLGDSILNDIKLNMNNGIR